MSNSASLGGVNATICDGEPLADGRRETSERAEPNKKATGSVNKTIFEDRVLAIGRHEKAGPNEAAAEERVNQLQSAPAGAYRRKATCPQQLLRAGLAEQDLTIGLDEWEIADVFGTSTEPLPVDAVDIGSCYGPPESIFDLNLSEWALDSGPSGEL